MKSFARWNVDLSKFLYSEVPKTKVRWKCSDFVLKMLEDGTCADVKFETYDGGCVRAHFGVLTHVCPYLCEGYDECHIELCKEVDCNIEEHLKSICIEMSTDALELFLILLYTTNKDDDFVVRELSGAIDKHFEEVHTAVREYDFERRLDLVLLPALARHLTPENCWRFYQDSLTITHPHYKTSRGSEICYNYILGNYTEAISSNTVLQQMKWNSKRLQRIMRHAESQAARQEALQLHLAKCNADGTDNIKDEELSVTNFSGESI